MLTIALILLTSLLTTTQVAEGCAEPRWEIDPLPVSRLLEYKTFFSAAHGGDATYAVYLPAGYDRDTTTRYPVLYWLHGGASNLRSGLGFVVRLDEAIASGVAPPIIVVLPNGPRSMWTDSNPDLFRYNAPIETLIVDELIPLIDSSYRTIASRDGRGIEGFSMGGRGSSRLGLRYPDLFSVVSNLAGAVQDWDYFVSQDPANVIPCVFGNDEIYFNAMSPQTHASENAAYIKTVPFQIRLVVGEADGGNYRANLEFSDFLTGLGITNTFVAVPGAKHNYEKLYDVQGDSMFTFFADAWGDL